jgi:hypothetical protein
MFFAVTATIVPLSAVTECGELLGVAFAHGGGRYGFASIILLARAAACAAMLPTMRKAKVRILCAVRLNHGLSGRSNRVRTAMLIAFHIRDITI